jgi:FkbM family methyltransferase
VAETPFTTEIDSRPESLPRALALAGIDESLRNKIFDALRRAELSAKQPQQFREQVRWPIVLSLLQQVGVHRILMSNGLVFEICPDSRIEQALLLSTSARPDHVWEPQTTKLLTALAADHVVVGGAYIGDQALFIARALAERNSTGQVHAFEPMDHAFRRLLRNIEINKLANVQAHRLALWDNAAELALAGHAGLASSVPVDHALGVEVVAGISIDEYLKRHDSPGVGLIMLDTEGGEERALRGARDLLSRAAGKAPQVIFELHRNFVDWSDGLLNTSIVKLLVGHGYHIYAIRDLHGNFSMTNQPIEVIPAEAVYLDGPPHGFNMLASKEPDIVARLHLRVVRHVSPKLIPEKDPALHHPVDGFRSDNGK